LKRDLFCAQEDTLRYLIDCLAAALIAAAFLALSGLVIEIVPHLSSVASAAPGERAENAPPEYFPARFRHVQVWGA